MPSVKPNWVAIIICLEVILVSAYAWSIHINQGEALPIFDVDGFFSLPSWLQAGQLFCLGALPLRLFFQRRVGHFSRHGSPSNTLLLFTSGIFLSASLDELFKIHLQFQPYYLGKIVYLGLGLSIPILFFQDIKQLLQQQPRAMRTIAIGIAVFLAGGFGLEIFRRTIQEPFWYRFFGRWQFYQVDSIRTAIEEFSEMLGETIVLYGTLRLTKGRKAPRQY